jgi:two-component system sensor histidine kinase and response regulator WspE
MIGDQGSTLVDLFHEEARAQAALLTEEVLALESNPDGTDHLARLMRAAHSLKGAARIVGRDVIVRVAHAMEDWFVAAQKGASSVTPAHVDVLLSAIDLVTENATLGEQDVAAWALSHAEAIQDLLQALSIAQSGTALPEVAKLRLKRPTHPASGPGAVTLEAGPAPPDSVRPETGRADQRIGTASLDRLLGLTSEALVASHMLDAYATDSRSHRQAHHSLGEMIDELRESLMGVPLDARARRALHALQRHMTERRDLRHKRDAELSAVSQRLGNVVARLYREVLESRMRPFEEGTVAFARMVRDLARDLDRDARLIVAGGSTPVDREVLRRLDGPLVHLLRNAVDHGIGSTAQRVAAGKPERGTISVTARHGGGRLLITVEDDGCGIDVEGVRAAVIRKKHADVAAAAIMSEKELLEFLFLPGFSLRDEVTEVSGRGVGLDAVRTTVHEIGGSIRVTTSPARGTRFELQLPLTLSVVRALIVEVAGQPCAIPLARIRCVLRLSRETVESIEGRQHFALGSRQVGLMWAHDVLGIEAGGTESESTAVIVVDDNDLSYGMAVDRLLGEQEIVLRGLDPQLGKVRNIGAAALLPNGSPVLVLDVDDLVRSIANLLAGGRMDPLRRTSRDSATKKRVLIADDSPTVRELERKLISGRGYEVDLAVDGMDAWNAIRSASYDLLLTDVDMPRLDGVELVSLVRKDPSLRSLPIVIVSYKDREEDRRRGLEAGADFYLTKASFFDETMLQAIEDLIGAPAS